MNWMILGIEPTKDKKAITAAYRAQLAHTNSEDKPEEFKALRATYEEAWEQTSSMCWATRPHRNRTGPQAADSIIG